MKQFILKDELVNNTVRLEGKDFHYLVHVRRLAIGESFTAILPNGNETVVQVISVHNGVLTGRCTNGFLNEETTNQKIPQIILFQALPKGDKMDLIVRQAAESGIKEIVPFLSEFSLAKIKNSILDQKLSRWNRIVKEARQQSGSKIATTIRQPMTIKELFNYWKNINSAPAGNSLSSDTEKINDFQASAKCILGLLFHQKSIENNNIHSYLYNIPDFVVITIGPEGGFSEKEINLFSENNFKIVSIGDTVLRTETAALYFAAAVRIILLESDTWELKQMKSSSV